MGTCYVAGEGSGGGRVGGVTYDFFSLRCRRIALNILCIVSQINIPPQLSSRLRYVYGIYVKVESDFDCSCENTRVVNIVINWYAFMCTWFQQLTRFSRPDNYALCAIHGVG